MKILLSHEAGGPETLRFEERPDPVPGPGQLLVRVMAVSINFPDTLIIVDRYQLRPTRPFAPGSELAGVVEAIGSGVEGFGIGDRICALTAYGALAERVVTEAWRSFVIPKAMPFDVAASLIMTYATSLHGLTDRTGLAEGDTLFVLGAAGGVGLSAVEIGKAIGARVVAGVSSLEKGDAARAAGADDVIVYPRGPLDRDASKALGERFKAACPGGYTVIYDPVGGDYAEPALRAIAWEGRYAVVGFTAGIPHIALNLALLKSCSIVGVAWGGWAGRNRAGFARQMATLFAYWAEGRIRPLISSRVPFADAPAAIAALGARQAIGKTVVSVGA